MPKPFQLDRPTTLTAVLLAGMTLALFGPVISFQFINVDDNVYVTANDHVRQGLSWHNAAWALTALEAANWHPVTWLSHMLDVTLFGLNPGGHHATSLLIHALNVILLFLCLRSMTGELAKSALVAALFAVHPLGLESVAWIAERKNVLSTLFLLLTLGAYIWYARKPGVLRYSLVAFVFTLGLMSKPMLVIAVRIALTRLLAARPVGVCHQVGWICGTGSIGPFFAFCPSHKAGNRSLLEISGEATPFAFERRQCSADR
jgi:hypothetical protein